MKRYVQAITAVFLLIIVFSGCSNVNLATTTIKADLKAVQATTQVSTSAVSTKKNETTLSVTTETKKNGKTTSKTTAVQTTKNAVTQKVTKNTSEITADNMGYCTILISCKTIADNKDKLKASKTAFVPSDYQILKETKVKLQKNDTAFDILKRVCKENQCSDRCVYCQKNGIQFEATYTPVYESYYIKGIHQIYEKDCGTKSGWIFKMNGQVCGGGCSKYAIKNGDKIEWLYTCNSGEDVY